TPSTNSAVAPSQLMLIQFTLGANYSNVTISASLTTFTSGESGTAFLTNQVGPGTTLVNQLATTNFTFALAQNFTTLTKVPLFSGLTLKAGTYNLVFSSAFSDTGISRNPSATYATAAGTSVRMYFSNPPNINTAYSPASTFTQFNQTLFFTVTGVP